MIVEAEKLGVKDDGLADLSVLVDGFLQLVRTTAEQRPAGRCAASVATRLGCTPRRVGRPSERSTPFAGAHAGRTGRTARACTLSTMSACRPRS